MRIGLALVAFAFVASLMIGFWRADIKRQQLLSTPVVTDANGNPVKEKP